ncbi:hypothetical protein B0H11DRAFT_86696 [Mycena galericulata]|nr:hypothetical protein B0H11DRAFT_86696 [Mycena galericulata]
MRTRAPPSSHPPPLPPPNPPTGSGWRVEEGEPFLPFVSCSDSLFPSRPPPSLPLRPPPSFRPRNVLHLLPPSSRSPSPSARLPFPSSLPHPFLSSPSLPSSLLYSLSSHFLPSSSSRPSSASPLRVPLLPRSSPPPRFSSLLPLPPPPANPRLSPPAARSGTASPAQATTAAVGRRPWPAPRGTRQPRRCSRRMRAKSRSGRSGGGWRGRMPAHLQRRLRRAPPPTRSRRLRRSRSTPRAHRWPWRSTAGAWTA